MFPCMKQLCGGVEIKLYSTGVWMLQLISSSVWLGVKKDLYHFSLSFSFSFLLKKKNLYNAVFNFLLLKFWDRFSSSLVTRLRLYPSIPHGIWFLWNSFVMKVLVQSTWSQTFLSNSIYIITEQNAQVYWLVIL